LLNNNVVNDKERKIYNALSFFIDHFGGEQSLVRNLTLLKL